MAHELPKTLPYVDRFFDEVQYSQKFEAPQYIQWWEYCINSGVGIYLVSEDSKSEFNGFLAGTISKEPNSSDLSFFESLFWAREDSKGVGIKMLRTLEKDLINLGVKNCYMASVELEENRAGEFYRRVGYKADSVTYKKVLFD